MKTLSYTLLSDGSSDQALHPILEWLLEEHVEETAIMGQWADLGFLRKAPRKALVERIRATAEFYPCDVLFVHRDAEKEPALMRADEIHSALRQAGIDSECAVCVVPVRMLEAWLLFDEKAIRKAANNPNGESSLDLPKLKTVESLPDPKKILHDAIRSASGLSGRRASGLNVGVAVQRISELVTDFTPLRRLPAFRHLEEQIAEQVAPRYR